MIPEPRTTAYVEHRSIAPRSVRVHRYVRKRIVPQLPRTLERVIPSPVVRAVRVRLDPLPRSFGSVGVSGVEVGFTIRGSGRTQGKRDGAVPAELAFFATLFADARKKGDSERVEVLRMKGDFALKEGGTKPVFTLAPSDQAGGTDSPSDETQTSSSDKARLVRIAFATGQFENVPVAPVPVLELPIKPGFQFFEVDVELSINGAVEAPSEANDILDVALVPRPSFSIQIVDEVGEPLGGTTVKIARGEQVDDVEADENGWLRVDDLAFESAAISLDADACRSLLKPRWEKSRKGSRVAASESVTVCALKAPLAPVVVKSGEPHRVSIQPPVTLARMQGLLFDTNKNFLLPSAIPALTSMQSLYDAHAGGVLLIVGHTDTSGEATSNSKLSLARAEAMAAYLKEDVTVWQKRYQSSVPQVERWGAHEDLLMIQTLSDFASRAPDEDPMAWFARTRGFPLSTPLSSAARTQLIKEYMTRDAALLPSDMQVLTHGCGEHFPLWETGDTVESDPKNGAHDQLDRRVELFFFQRELGIQPPVADRSVSGKDSKEYPEWRRRAALETQITVDGATRLLRLRVLAKGRAVGSADYKLFVNDVLVAAAQTTPDGLIVQPLPVRAETARIEVDSIGLVRVLSLVEEKAFPPISTLAGALQRLAQLGFYSGEVSDDAPAELAGAAIRSFKRSKGLGDSATLDANTRAAIVAEYGS